jgi:hypothetical protein
MVIVFVPIGEQNKVSAHFLAGNNGDDVKTLDKGEEK